MRRLALGLLIAVACQPAAAPTTQEAPADAQAPVARGGAICHEDIPDCSALCALRETGRTAYLDFFERRCAAVMQGKNPNKVSTDLQPTPHVDGGAAETAPASTTTEVTAPLGTTPPFDPTSVGRTGTGEPPECKAARLLRAQKHDREADVLAALCAVKGGDAGL